MDSNPSSSAPRSAESSVAACQHTENCCLVPSKQMGKIGKKWATALAGFVSGAVVAAIVLIPWMIFQGKLCTTKQVIPNNAVAPAPAFEGGEAPAPAPAPEAPAPAPAPAP